MPDWQLTATTQICDKCGAEVTIIIYGDGRSKCTGACMHSGKSAKPAAVCSADNCPQIAAYRAKLGAEDKSG